MRARTAWLALGLLVCCACQSDRDNQAAIPLVPGDPALDANPPLVPATPPPLPWWAADAATDQRAVATSGAAGSGNGSDGRVAQTPGNDQPPRAPTLSGLPDVEFGFDVVVPAGKELLKCIYAAFPSDRGVIAVPSAESEYTPGSHHLLAYRSDLTADQIPPDKTGVWDCNDSSWEIHDRGSYYEAQDPHASRDLPEGVAHKFQPGEVVILQAHYLNSSDADLDAQVKLTLHTVDPARVVHEAGSIIFADLNISVPPHSRARASMTCTLPQDFHPVLLWSHMHRRGVHFIAETDDAQAASILGPLFEEDDWSEPQPREFFDPSVVLPKGSHITFTCDYENDSDRTLRYGTSAETNEMCILHGMYWPRMTSGERCPGGVTKTMTLGSL